jgi:alcohol dehydrogenase class IV
MGEAKSNSMNFEFATTTRIVFGVGALREVGAHAKEFGHRAIVVTGRDTHRAEPLLSSLRDHGVTGLTFSVFGEPEIETVEQGIKQARHQHCEVVIGFGGGSALDAAKAIAAMLTNDGELLDYLEVIGRGKTLAKPSAPFIAIPTTAGTGSEVTRNAVLASARHHVKVSLRSPLMLPKLAIVDPALTYDLPPAITASTGLDALTQLIEPYVSARANPMTDALCLEGIRRAARSLKLAYQAARDKNSNSHAPSSAAREDMSVASLFGGLALANAGLGAVHGFAGPIGGMFPAPHGAVCAALLPHVMDANIRALRQREPESASLPRYKEVAHLLSGSADAKEEDGIAWVQSTVTELHIPPLGSYGITRQHTATLVGKATHASSMKANPIALTDAELSEILERAL